MDYEKKYKNALGWMQGLYNGLHGKTKEEAETYFPELKESEDEKIRKELINIINLSYDCGIAITKENYKKYIAWLEKQESVGEIVERCKTSWYNEGKIQGQIEGLSDDEKYLQGWHDALEKQGEKPQDEDEIIPDKNEVRDKDEKIRKELIDAVQGLWDNDALPLPLSVRRKNEWLAWLEKQGEQKPFDYENANIPQKDFSPKVTPKIEPKFKIGDYVVTDYIVGKIFAITDDSYLLDTGQGIPFSSNNVHLWTIEDAKDGDVLISQYNKPFIYNGNHNHSHIGSYCGISVEDKFKVATEKCNWAENVNIHPATKEQRDTLFARMREAGYEWDAEKKELKQMEGGEE